MAIMAHAKFHFNWLVLTLIFGIWASEPPLGPGERLKRPGLIGLIRSCHEDVILTRNSHNCAGTAFVQGNSAGGSKLIEQTSGCIVNFIGTSFEILLL